MKTFGYILLLCWAFVGVKANNVQLSNLQLVDSQTISFQISWENSWDMDVVAEPFNHDAVWVFLKGKGANGWNHLNVSNISSDHGLDDLTVLSVEAVDDGKGVFIRRMFSQAGDVPTTTVILKLAQPLSADVGYVRVFGVEMVYVPEGPFYAGDSISEQTLGAVVSKRPVYIFDESPLTVGSGFAHFGDWGDMPPAGTAEPDFPKGYAGFYCMKHEISQAQYRDFLNTLSYDQQVNRVSVSPDSPAGTTAMTVGNNGRNEIVVLVPGVPGSQPATYDNYVQLGENRACNYLGWGDLAAYLDWAALRPMTELEFEKACRGSAVPVKREFAWGTDKVVDANTVVNDGLIDETVIDTLPAGYGLASHGYVGPQGPLRNGFGGSSSSNRLSVGGSYYGILELSGNLWEQVVNLDTMGLPYTGIHGDGNLTIDGKADVINWPLGKGAGHKGGAWNSGVFAEFRDLAISDRFYIYLTPTRRGTSGGRGVRTP